MAEKELIETSEAQIAVHWQEEDYFYPSPWFMAQANMKDERIYERFSLDNFPNCFEEYADLLDWYEHWHTMLDTSDAPCWKWFVGGLINASFNCVDRHLEKKEQDRHSFCA
jgi:acetyl-CoA synthetase